MMGSVVGCTEGDHNVWVDAEAREKVELHGMLKHETWVQMMATLTMPPDWKVTQYLSKSKNRLFRGISASCSEPFKATRCCNITVWHHEMELKWFNCSWIWMEPHPVMVKPSPSRDRSSSTSSFTSSFNKTDCCHDWRTECVSMTQNENNSPGVTGRG